MDTITVSGSRLITILLESGTLLVVGVLASGLIDAFLSPADIHRLLPRRALPAALAGMLLGLLIPAGDLGSLVVARRMMGKGAVPALGMAYLVSGPVLHLVALAGLVAALGRDHAGLVEAVIGVACALALLAGLLFALYPATPGTVPVAAGRMPAGPGLRHALAVAARESREIGRWLVTGALLAAIGSLWLTLDALDRPALSPVESVGAGLLLGLGRGTGTIANAFAAPDLVAAFGSGAAASFLVMGAAANLTRLVALLAVFRGRIALGLAALAGLVAVLVGVWIALNTTW